MYVCMYVCMYVFYSASLYNVQYNKGTLLIHVFRIRFTWSKYLSVAAFLRPKYRNSLVMKIYKDIVTMWLPWKTWLTQPDRFNLQLQSPSWNYDPNIRMCMDPKKMVQHQVYTRNIGVTHQGKRYNHALMWTKMERCLSQQFIHSCWCIGMPMDHELDVSGADYLALYAR